MSVARPSNTISGTVLLVCLVVMFVVTIAASAAIALAIEDGARATSLIGLLLGSLGALAASVTTLYKVTSLGQVVDDVAQQTTDLTNGLLDSKVRAAVADVLQPHMIDPAADALLERDRTRRATATEASAALLQRRHLGDQADI